MMISYEQLIIKMADTIEVNNESPDVAAKAALRVIQDNMPFYDFETTLGYSIASTVSEYQKLKTLGREAPYKDALRLDT